MRNFSIQAKGQPISAGTTSQTTALDGGAAQPDVMIYNAGSATVYVRAGGSGVTADNTCMPILAGEKSAYYKGEATHLATLAASGTQSLLVFAGNGA